MKEGISVIIPAYNREEFIAEAIQSVTDQNYAGPLEIIIADDGSADKTLEIAQTFSHTVILRKPEGCTTQGASGARNRGLQAAAQPLICFLDSDDFYLPGHLDKMVLAMRNNPDAGFAFCRTLEVKTVDAEKLYKQWTHKRIFRNDIINPIVSRDKIINTNSLMFRKEVFEKIGGFNEAYSNGEDIDLWMRISEQFKGVFSNHYGAVYRIQHGSHQLTNNSSYKIDTSILLILNQAIARYHELGLKDDNRLFELKHLLLHRMYSNKKFTYLVKYLMLITRFPLIFLYRLKVSYHQFLSRKGMSRWAELKSFIGQEV